MSKNKSTNGYAEELKEGMLKQEKEIKEKRTEKELKGVTLLGNQKVKYQYDYNPDILETFDNMHKENDYFVKFNCVEFSSLCVTGDTIIDVACDETIHPQGIPIKELVNTEGYVFGFDTNTGKAVVKKYSNVRKTQKDAKIVEIQFELFKGPVNNRVMVKKSIKCTPNHQILVRTGWGSYEWVEARNLKPEDQLMSDQRTEDMIRYSPRHRLIYEGVHGEIQKDNLIHHKDFNHYDNMPTNLKEMSTEAHFSLHQSAKYGYDDSIDIQYIIDLYNAGMSVPNIANEFNCDYSTIYTRLNDKVKFRTQPEQLKLNAKFEGKYSNDNECLYLYNKGYTTYELAKYYSVHDTTVSTMIRRAGGQTRTSLQTKILRKELELPSLNHRVISVINMGYEDVYNMEVEDVECYFANGIVIHNCPRTGQPDWATIYISYIPSDKMVESKSLKLYLFSYRNFGEFHEDCANRIMKDLIKLMSPKYIEVTAKFLPRGGISIFPFCNYANEEEKYQKMRDYRMLNHDMYLEKIDNL